MNTAFSAAVTSLLLAGTLALVASGRRAEAAPPVHPVLVELFTSQGCSSCPPADRLLAKLAAAPAAERAVIPLAFHVDYWNHLGWQDPFSSARWSQRQARYAEIFGSNRIYTPQAVIAGIVECVGSDAANLQRFVTRAASEPVRASVRLTATRMSGGSLTVTVDADRKREEGAALAEVVVALFQDGLETPVRGGENADRRLHDERVVRRLERAFTLPAGGGGGQGKVELAVDPSWPISRLGIVAFVQEPASLRVLAVTEARAAG